MQPDAAADAVGQVDGIVSDLEEAREKESNKRESMFEMIEPPIEPEPFPVEPILSPHAFPANLLDMSDSFRAGSSRDRDLSGEGAINLQFGTDTHPELIAVQSLSQFERARDGLQSRGREVISLNRNEQASPDYEEQYSVSTQNNEIP